MNGESDGAVALAKGNNLKRLRVINPKIEDTLWSGHKEDSLDKLSSPQKSRDVNGWQENDTEVPYSASNFRAA